MKNGNVHYCWIEADCSPKTHFPKLNKQMKKIAGQLCFEKGAL